ncbi:MAG: ROK family protein [bacterium]
MKPLYISVDIGGTTIQLAASKTGEQVDEMLEFELASYETPALWLEYLFDKNPRFKGANWVVGVPGSVKKNRQLLETPNLPSAWAGSCIPDALSLFNINWLLENDANLAAFGEACCGAGVKYFHQICLTLGTGLGAGIIIDGKIYRGASGAAGELGHLQIEPGGRECGCGSRGCLETYASVSGLKRTYFELTGSWLSGREIAEKVETDEFAAVALRKTGLWLGRGLAQIINILEPQAVIFAGGLSRSLDLLLPHIKESSRPLLFARRTEKTPLLRSKLKYPALQGGLKLAATG